MNYSNFVHQSQEVWLHIEIRSGIGQLAGHLSNKYMHAFANQKPSPGEFEQHRQLPVGIVRYCGGIGTHATQLDRSQLTRSTSAG